MVCGETNSALRRKSRVEKIKAIRSKRTDSSDNSSDENVRCSMPSKINMPGPVERKEARRIRNRLSAMNSRLKIKDDLEYLQRRVEELERENYKLKSLITQPSEEESGLRSFGRVDISSEHAKFY